MAIVDVAVIVSYSVFVDILWRFILVDWSGVSFVGWCWSWSMIRCWSWSMIRCWSGFVAVAWSRGFISCGNSGGSGKGKDLKG